MPDGARYAWPPRLMRSTAAAHYLGMSESAFRSTVAPALREVRISAIGAQPQNEAALRINRL